MHKGYRETVMKQLLVLLTSMSLTACASHKGAIKPNSGLADFDKYGEAYYLSLEQIKIGDSKEVVTNEYGDKYESKTNDKGREIWIFKSYQATFATDPVEKLVIVEFVNANVSDVSEKYLRGKSPTTSKPIAADERLRKLKALHDDGVISDEDFESKKMELLRAM
jgi:hypothetical protein